MPPPPPPTLTAPPGYVEYGGSTTPTGTLKRVGTLGTWTMILTAVAGLTSILASVLLYPVIDTARQFVDGEITSDEFDEAYLGSQLVSGLQSVVALAAGIVTVIWMYRIASNLRVFSRQTTFHPVFSIVGWILPPFLFVLPLLVLRELWKGSDPDVAAGDRRWKQNRVDPLLYVWFVVYGLVPGILTAVVTVSTIESLFANGLDSTDTSILTAETVAGTAWLNVVGGLVTAVAAVVWVVFVRRLTNRHVALTRET